LSLRSAISETVRGWSREYSTSSALPVSAVREVDVGVLADEFLVAFDGTSI
jgi:hypothetical protein